MDLQQLLKSLDIERIQQWHLVCAAATTLALCIFTYLCYRFLFRTKSTKSKKPKSQKKRTEDKKATMTNSTTNSATVVNAAKPVVSASSVPKPLKPVPKKTLSPQPEASPKPNVQITSKTVPIKVVTIQKHSDPEPIDDSSSDATDGQWIEVKKNGKKQNKTNSLYDALAAPNPIATESGTITVAKNQTVGKKKSEAAKKQSGSGTEKKNNASSRHTVYEPIEEPTFTRPAKPNRRASGGDSVGAEEQEEWQEVRFSNKSRKSNK